MSTAPAPLIARRYAPSLLERARAIWARRETIRFLTQASLAAAHRHKVLGHLWNLLDPLLFMLVYFFVFGVLFGIVRGSGRPIEFMLYILTGLITYRFISGTISECANCIRANRGLIHEINFPKAVFPISVALGRLYDYVWGMVVLSVFMLLSGHWPSVHVLWLPLIAGLMLLFALGAGFLIAYVGAFFADTTNVIGVAMRLLFYCSPVFYFVRDRGPYRAMFHDETLRFFYMLNPLVAFFECTRDALLWGTLPQSALLGYAALCSILLCLAGFAVFTRGEGTFAKYI